VPKVAVVQLMSPLIDWMTHLSLMPYDTLRIAVPALQIPPSSAHFEYPDGQSTAWAAGTVNKPALKSAASGRSFIVNLRVVVVVLQPALRP
jgi:hypothetical protein